MDDFLSWASSYERSPLVMVSFFIVLVTIIPGVMVLIVVFPYSLVGLVLLCMLFLIKEYRKHKRGSEGG